MGGVEFFSDNLALALSKRGAHVLIVTTDPCNAELERPFEIFRIPSRGLLAGRYPVFNAIQASKNVTALLKEQAINSYVINGRFYELSRFGAKLARKNGAEPIVIDHSSSYVASTDSLLGKLLAIADHATTRCLNHYHPAYYCVSQLSSEWIRTFNIRSSGEIHNAIDAASFTTNASSFQIAPQSTAAIKVLYAGRLIEEKGVKKAIEAIKLTRSNAELFIAGSGPLEPYVQREANQDGRVHYLGRLNHPDLASTMIRSDIFCFPTEYGEGLPTSLLEAGACGCALITTRTGGTAEIIPTDDHGVVLNSTAPDEIARQIDHLAEDRVRLNRMQAIIRNHVMHNFSWQNTVNELLRALEAVSQ